MPWISFGALSCRGGGNLITARVSKLLKSHASPDMRLFSLCNKKSLAIRHMNKPLFETTLSIPSYDMGNYVGLRTYQHPLVFSKDVRSAMTKYSLLTLQSCASTFVMQFFFFFRNNKEILWSSMNNCLSSFSKKCFSITHSIIDNTKYFS